LKISCLVWAPFSDRMDELATALDAERKNLSFGYLPRYLAPMKYLLFFVMTQVYLFRKRPDVVYAQNPPVFCPLACVPYCRITRKRLIVDHHNIWSVKVFGSSRLALPFRALERVLAVFADINTVPHDVWRDGLLALSAKRVVTVHDHVDPNPFERSQRVRDRVSPSGVIGIASGHQGYPLERVESEALAAESVTGVTLAMTGPPARLAPRLGKLGTLRNVRYLGYLPKEEYERLKASCDFAMNITDEPYTLNHVLFEYAAASLPTISTRREVIESVFGDALLYVDVSDVASVTEKIRTLVGNPAVLDDYRARISNRFTMLTSLRKAELALLLKVITSGSPGR
jgi:glycosyltransferase involved in cell wall biosynthesis